MSGANEVVIIGGNAAGMSCATRLRRLDEKAKITIVEKGPVISFGTCGIPYVLGQVIQVPSQLNVQSPAKMQQWFNLDILINTELLEIDRGSETVRIRDSSGTPRQLHYDKLVLAIGAEPTIPDVPGIQSKHVFALHTAQDLHKVRHYLAGGDARWAAVIGGGFIGLETAENLHRLGLRTTVIERFPHILPGMDEILAEGIQAELRGNGVRLVLNARVTHISEPDGMFPGLVHVHGYEPISADLVIVATGVRARTLIAAKSGLRVGSSGVIVDEKMETTDPDIYAVGDMVKAHHALIGHRLHVPLAGPACRQGRIAADNICGRASRYRGNVGTSVCKIFGLSFGMAGLSNQALRDMGGAPFEYITIHPPQHATYYPGAHIMTMQASFEIPSGKILGVQIVGPEGVDKRLDVISTAIQAGMKISDLADLELGYAPQFGSAKDPVNMLGFVGQNILRKEVRILHPSDLPSKLAHIADYVVFDVRSPEEFRFSHVPGAVSVPLGQLRSVAQRLSTQKPVLAYCWVGYKSYIACRILQQMGFRAFYLDGGLKSLRSNEDYSLEQT
jgi:NADPH-dependent 2,4-dienoyl-CoA reductase/sulfur reductase-like enzyme/rhodanese-related sulfurtransferase